MPVNGVANDRGSDLMLAVQRGDTIALARLHEIYNSRLYSFVLRILRDPLAAEDALQETWLSLFERRHSYSPTFAFSTWIFTIARRKAISELRRRKVRSIFRPYTSGAENGQDLSDAPQSTFATPDATVDMSALWEKVEVALASLPALQREIVMLRDIEGFENEEVAAILELKIQPGALRKRVFDARCAFRAALDKLGANEFRDGSDGSKRRSGARASSEVASAFQRGTPY